MANLLIRRLDNQPLIKQNVAGDGWCLWHSIAASLYPRARANEWKDHDDMRYAGLMMYAAGAIFSKMVGEVYRHEETASEFLISKYGDALKLHAANLISHPANTETIEAEYSASIRLLFNQNDRDPPKWHQMDRLDFEAVAISLSLDGFFFYDDLNTQTFLVSQKYNPGSKPVSDFVMCDANYRGQSPTQKQMWDEAADSVREIIATHNLLYPEVSYFGLNHNGVHYSGLTTDTIVVSGDAAFPHRVDSPDDLSEKSLLSNTTVRLLSQLPTKSPNARQSAVQSFLKRVAEPSIPETTIQKIATEVVRTPVVSPVTHQSISDNCAMIEHFLSTTNDRHNDIILRAILMIA